MKYPTFFLVLLLLVTISILPSCEEVPPNIILEETEMPEDTVSNNAASIDSIRSDTTFIAANIAEAQAKVVVMEEFSGVRCINCPEGHEQAQALLDAYPDRFATLTIHAGFLSAPYPETQTDYVLSVGETLYDFLGTEAVPAASIDRITFDGENAPTILVPSKWAARVTQQLDVTTPVNVYLYYDYNEGTRNLSVYVQMQYTQAVSTEHYLSVALSESHIIDAQLIPEEGGKVQTDYEHNHVLRALLTPATGQVLGASKELGRVIVQTFDFNIPQDWNSSYIEIVAFVHENGSNKQILQGAKIHL